MIHEFYVAVTVRVGQIASSHISSSRVYSRLSPSLIDESIEITVSEENIYSHVSPRPTLLIPASTVLLAWN
jgi:hypothetical protein